MASEATVRGVDLDLLADPAADQGLAQRRLDRDVQVVEWGLDRAGHQEPLGVAVGELDCHLVSEFDDARVLRCQLVGGDGLLQDPGQEGQLAHVMPVLRAGPPVPVKVIEVGVGEPGNPFGRQPGCPRCQPPLSFWSKDDGSSLRLPLLPGRPMLAAVCRIGADTLRVCDPCHRIPPWRLKWRCPRHGERRRNNVGRPPTSGRPAVGIKLTV